MTLGSVPWCHKVQTYRHFLKLPYHRGAAFAKHRRLNLKIVTRGKIVPKSGVFCQYWLGVLSPALSQTSRGWQIKRERLGMRQHARSFPCSPKLARKYEIEHWSRSSKTINWSADSFQINHVTSMSWHMSPRYGHVILVSGYPVLTDVNWPYCECPI